MVWLRKLFRTRLFRARSWDKKLGPLPSKNSLKWSGVPTEEGVNWPVVGRTAESQVFQFTMSIFLSIHLRVLKMFWGAVFRERLVLGRILAADCTGVCALLYCKSALVLVVWVSSDTGIGTGMQFLKLQYTPCKNQQKMNSLLHLDIADLMCSGAGGQGHTGLDLVCGFKKWYVCVI